MDISVIVTAYNSEKYISKTLDSIIGQVFDGSMEVLVGDDCSTDSTPEIIALYQNRYPALIKAFYNDTNLGYCHNYYRLAQQAKGDFIAICDNDDLWIDPYKLSIQHSFMGKNRDIGMVCSNANIINKNDTLLERSSIKEGLIPFSDLIYQHSDVYSPTILMRRDLFEKMAEQRLWYIENDCFFDSMWTLWFSYYSKVYCLPDYLSAYRVLKESGCHSSSYEKQYILEKKYTMLKTHFILENLPLDEICMDFFSKEYDYVYRLAEYRGQQKVRDTKAYKFGKVVRRLFRIK